MTAVIVSRAAEADLNAITDFYLTEAGIVLAAGFMTAWDGCIDHLDAFPASGSPRLAGNLAIAGLRVWPIKGFPQLVLYLETAQGVTIQRVLHSARDLQFVLRD
ncbi:MAG: plasmid stabilization protein [Cypionkella sp.]|uniref:type II toxin-antitoxin system RelE/ParE family toxin n=1 Tax=Cypionkella sp. TaxID=2811411 RepID=UPI00261E59FB|nr:type II toxin-antitoxin system RelE/ParE family toxin [Cypionkella sp.]MDB5658942.1 plasmid stabilization protein [Cypionkella sp.]MDB5665669.1 plasmid stabilization protein [Cypionkella sp.]